MIPFAPHSTARTVKSALGLVLVGIATISSFSLRSISSASSYTLSTPYLSINAFLLVGSLSAAATSSNSGLSYNTSA